MRSRSSCAFAYRRVFGKHRGLIERKDQIVVNGVRLVDRGCLKFASNSEAVDLEFLQLGQIDVVAVRLVKSHGSGHPGGCVR